MLAAQLNLSLDRRDPVADGQRDRSVDRAHQGEAPSEQRIGREDSKCHGTDRRGNEHYKIHQIRHLYFRVLYPV